MATVHLGRLLGPVGFSRTVALKRLHPQFACDPEFVAMFLDEARIAARIRHPNVAATLDVVAEGSELLLVMEYVEGETLSRLLRASRQRAEPIPLAVVSAIGVALLHGLHAAHEAVSEQGEPLGVVHRDVSPQNVLVGVDGVPRVVDFGIAKAIGRSQVTREGQLKGKLPYMAPEQLRRGGAITRATDVYAAAVVLWETLTGRRLFDGEDGQVLSAVLAGDVPSPRALRRDTPVPLEALVLRGLSADPDARFATAEEMAHALEAAVPPATASEVAAWVRSLADDALARRARIAAVVESVVITPPQETATPTATPAVTPRPRRLLLGLALVLLGGTLAWGLLFVTSAPPPVVPAEAKVVPGPASSSVAASATPAPSPSVASSSSPTSSAAPTKVSSPPPPKPKPNPCDPPYRWENGIKKFKPECL